MSDEQIEKAATTAVEMILTDLSDRKGLGDEWGGIDEDIQEEIRERWESLIGAAIRSAR